MQPGWCQPVRQEFMENESEVLPGVAYPGVWDNRSTLNTKTGYDDDDVADMVVADIDVIQLYYAMCMVTDPYTFVLLPVMTVGPIAYPFSHIFEFRYSNYHFQSKPD